MKVAVNTKHNITIFSPDDNSIKEHAATATGEDEDVMEVTTYQKDRLLGVETRTSKGFPIIMFHLVEIPGRGGLFDIIAALRERGINWTPRMKA